MIYNAIFSLLSIPIIIFNANFLDLPSKPQIISKPEPIEVKGIYLTAYTAGSKSLREPHVKMIEETELNAVVIDLKDYSGKVFFDTGIELAKEVNSQELRIKDLADFMAELKSKNIYTIARISVFQDPHLAENRVDLALKTADGRLWRDWKGLAWVDITSKEVWQYNLDISKKAVELGFDEINLDYIRFPSDGNLKQIVYQFENNDNNAKNQVMADFFKYVGEQFAYQPAYISLDLFGMTLWRSDGLGIGQRFEDALDHVDYICPMVYPSHYPSGFENFSNPAEHPYEIVYSSLEKANTRFVGKKAKLRPWLQDFNLGAKYGPDMIRKQIQATYDAGWDSWLLWNASNRYTKAALLNK